MITYPEGYLASFTVSDSSFSLLYKWSNRICFLGLVAILLSACEDDPAPFSNGLTANPREVQLIHSDVDLFWKVHDEQSPQFSGNVWYDRYFNAGTEALRLYFDKKVKDANKLSIALKAAPYKAYYDGIRKNTENVAMYYETIYASFEALKALYPEAVFNDVVFVMGAFNAGGTVVNNGQMVVAVEFFTKDEQTPTEGLTNFTKTVTRDASYLPSIVLHELIHIEQVYFAEKNGLNFGGEQTLLDLALMEGCADFITYLILDKYFNDHLPERADRREESLWEEFKQDMDAKDISRWLYNGGSALDRTPDLGYYMGFKIAEHFYNQASDKQQAVKEIIQISNGKAFLEESGYAQKFDP